jgi:hypothetical protein
VTRLLDGRHHLEQFAMDQAGEVDYLITGFVISPGDSWQMRQSHGNVPDTLSMQASTGSLGDNA